MISSQTCLLICYMSNCFPILFLVIWKNICLCCLLEFICRQKFRSIKTNNVFKIILIQLLQATYSFIYNALVYCNFLKATSYYCYPIKPDKYCTNLSDLGNTQFHFISVVCFLFFLVLSLSCHHNRYTKSLGKYIFPWLLGAAPYGSSPL